MNNPIPTSPAKPGLGRTLPPGQTQTSYNSAYVQVGLFVLNPMLVQAFMHRPSTGESVPSTEVLYGSHHIAVPDANQALFFYLCSLTKPQEVKIAL